jgi:hypothetical protein
LTNLSISCPNEPTAHYCTSKNYCPILLKIVHRFTVHSVEDPECLYRIRILRFFHSGSQIRIRTFFIPDPGSYIKRGMKNKNYLFSCFLWFQEEVFKVKNITHPGSGSRIQVVKKHRIPDPQHCVQHYMYRAVLRIQIQLDPDLLG